jgi:hypothetical protein
MEESSPTFLTTDSEPQQQITKLTTDLQQLEEALLQLDLDEYLSKIYVLRIARIKKMIKNQRKLLEDYTNSLYICTDNTDETKFDESTQDESKHNESTQDESKHNESIQDESSPREDEVVIHINTDLSDETIDTLPKWKKKQQRENQEYLDSLDKLSNLAQQKNRIEYQESYSKYKTKYINEIISESNLSKQSKLSKQSSDMSYMRKLNSQSVIQENTNTNNNYHISNGFTILTTFYQYWTNRICNGYFAGIFCCLMPLFCCCIRVECLREISLLKCFLYLFTTNFFSNETDELTILSKISIIFGILFEIYKTMIGSFLIIFTTQRCGESVCTLIQNFIPKDRLELVAITFNFLQAFSLIVEYCFELYREFHLREVYYNDNRLPHNPNFLDMVENMKECTNDVLINRIYKMISLCVFNIYLVNVMVSAAVIYKNYYDNTSLINFATNALFIIFKITNVLKITSSKNQTISAYIQQNIVYNRVKKQYIKPLYMDFFDNVESKEYTDFFKNSKSNMYNSVLLSPTRYLIKNSNFMEVLFEKPMNSIEQKKDEYCDNSYPYLDTYVQYLKNEKLYEKFVRSDSTEIQIVELIENVESSENVELIEINI